MLASGSAYDGGLSNFYINTSQDYSILAGLAAGVAISTIISVTVSWKSFVSRKQYSRTSPNNREIEVKHEKHVVNDDKVENNSADDEDVGETEWEKTMSIDNPLNPYKTLYKDQLKQIGFTGERVTTKHLSKLFKRARIISFICAAVSFTVFIVVIPSFALSQTVLTQAQMETWVMVCQNWCLVATVLVVVIPPFQEGLQIWKQYNSNKLDSDERHPCTNSVEA